MADAKKPVDPSLVDLVETPQSLADVPVIGEYLSTLVQSIMGYNKEEALMLANAFEKNREGKLVLKFHNPFVEAAIFAVIEPELKRLISEAAAAREARDAEEEGKDRKAVKA